MLNRKSRLEARLINTLSSSPVARILVLTGARQVGKTTLLRHLFPHYSYINMDEPLLRKEVMAMSASQWTAAYENVIVDEVQKCPEVLEMIKAAHDRGGEQRYMVTGSSQLMLMNNVKESLAGRCIIEELYPLTLPELMTNGWADEAAYSNFQKIILGQGIPEFIPFRLQKNYEQKMAVYESYLLYGGYPALVANSMKASDKQKWLKNYIKTYLERDIRDLADFKSLEPFTALKKASAISTGHALNYSSLAREVGVTPNTAHRFVQYLEMSYQVILVQPWFKNKLKRLSKMPKLHYLDPGIQRTLVGNVNPHLSGSEFESAIVAEMYKQLQYIDIHTSLYHLRTSDGREVDLLIETPHGYYAFEIKMTSNYNHTDNRHLRNLEEILDKPLLHSFVLTQDTRPNQIDNTITAVHAADFLTSVG
jgi:predicted AAA+ superfamily ATPase